MESDFLGNGWGFPVELEPGRGRPCRIESKAAESSIQDAIWIILATAPGERVMRPDFGCGIHRLVFAVNNTATRETVLREVRQALTLWEPRIDVLDVTVQTKDRGELRINIRYRVRTTNNLFNMVFPFYLEGGVR